MSVRYLTTALAVITSLFFCACAQSTSANPEDQPDANTDTGSETVTESETDTGSPPADGGIDSGPDANVPEPGTAGDPCWTEILTKWHPNYGLAGCEQGYKCIGDSDEAWCTERCPATGAINDEGGGLDGFCCGELTEPCNPQRYWLPQSMSFFCIPLIAPLAAECDLDTEWTGENSRCAAVCDGEEVVHKTQCAQYEGGTFCTYQCDPSNGDADCLIEPAFEGGCCGSMMGGSWCLIPELCTTSAN